MSTYLSLEVNEKKDNFLSIIYPAPKPLPTKFNSIFIPLPGLWREALLQVDELKDMGFNSIHFGPIMGIDNNDHPQSMGEDLVRFYINEFHRSGMHVILTTNPAGPWADYRSEERDDWDENIKNRRKNGTFVDEYMEQVLLWAEIAEELDVAAFIPANEIQMITTNHSYLEKKAEEILPEIRQRYNGLIGFNIQATGESHYVYELTDYDFIISMGSTPWIDEETREIYPSHLESLYTERLGYLNNVANQYDIDQIWFSFLLFNGSGNYWEPNNDNPSTILTAEESSEYADILMDIVYGNVTGISPVFDTGFMIFDDPLPTIWEKYFSEYNQETQAEENWLESDLYKLEECFFPEWDSLYALPWGEQTIPDYWANMSSNENIMINGKITYQWPRYFHVTNFSFNSTAEDIEIRLADDRTGELLTNIARLYYIGSDIYQDAELALYWPDHLEEHMFNYCIIYDAEKQVVLGQYPFQPPNY